MPQKLKRQRHRWLVRGGRTEKHGEVGERAGSAQVVCWRLDVQHHERQQLIQVAPQYAHILLVCNLTATHDRHLLGAAPW